MITYYNSGMFEYGKGVSIIIKNEMSGRKILANNILHFRMEKGWTQEDLADKLDTTTNYVSTLENAQRNTRIDYIEHIAHTLDVPISQLFAERDIPKNKRIKNRKKV